MAERSPNIYLCGMIGSGKTTVGRRLAEELELPFYDLDQEMDRVLGYSFHRLVEEKGWVPFRELEYSICKRFARHEKCLMCLGGGTVRYDWNMDVLQGTGFFILFTASLDELVRRVRLEPRPRVNVGATLEGDLRTIWEQAEEKYRRAADLTCETDGKSVEMIVAELLPALRRRLCGTI
jgi:shikimate kinase